MNLINKYTNYFMKKIENNISYQTNIKVKLKAYIKHIISKMATTLGEKGSDVYTFDGVNDPRVALSALIIRNQSEDIILNGMKKILYNSTITMPGYNSLIEDAFLLAFQSRNIRGGKGERDVSMIMFNCLACEKKSLMLKVIKLIPHYGYWKDMFIFYFENKDFDIKNKIYDIVINQLDEDEKNMKENKSISLLAKWMPRQQDSNKLSNELAQKMFTIGTFSHKMKLYRKRITALNKYLNTVEINQCDKKWADIKPAQVPGRALAKYKKAFLNELLTNTSRVEGNIRFPNDPDRVKCAENFKNHMNLALNGGAKVNASNTVMPHEIYKNILRTMKLNNMTEDEKNINRVQWNTIRDDIKEKGTFNKMIAMCDFSGSMDGDPKLVSGALGILFSEICVGIGKNKIMTFDSTPQWINFDPSMDIYKKVSTILSSHLGQGLSTDFQKAMELIIKDLKMNKTPLDEAPTDLVVFTDMAWDAAYSSSQTSSYTNNTYRHHVKTAPWQTHIEMIRTSFKSAGEDNFGEGKGYAMPRIIIWNLRSNTQDFHAQADTPGVMMMSGWSPSLFKYIMKEGFKTITPYETLRMQLDDPIYDLVRNALRT
jgi:hypothetical protein